MYRLWSVDPGKSGCTCRLWLHVLSLWLLVYVVDYRGDKGPGAVSGFRC